jgi:hypothetical protein
MNAINVNDEFELSLNGKVIKVKYDGVSLYPAMLKFSFFGRAIGRTGKRTVKLAVEKYNALCFQDYIECGYVLAKNLQQNFFKTSPPLPTTQNKTQTTLI